MHFNIPLDQQENRVSLPNYNNTNGYIQRNQGNLNVLKTESEGLDDILEEDQSDQEDENDEELTKNIPSQNPEPLTKPTATSRSEQLKEKLCSYNLVKLKYPNLTFEDHFQRIEKIGEGTYGVVYMAKDLRNNDVF